MCSSREAAAWNAWLIRLPIVLPIAISALRELLHGRVDLRRHPGEQLAELVAELVDRTQRRLERCADEVAMCVSTSNIARPASTIPWITFFTNASVSRRQPRARP